MVQYQSFENQKIMNIIFNFAPKSTLTPYHPKGGLPNSMIFRCSPLGLGVKQMKIIEFSTFQNGRIFLKIIKTKTDKNR
jgi:hypothetical protein